MMCSWLFPFAPCHSAWRENRFRDAIEMCSFSLCCVKLVIIIIQKQESSPEMFFLISNNNAQTGNISINTLMN